MGWYWHINMIWMNCNDHMQRRHCSGGLKFIYSNNLDYWCIPPFCSQIYIKQQLGCIWLWMAWFQPATVEFWSRSPMFLNSWCSNPIPTRGCLLRLRPKKSGTYRPGLFPHLYLPFCQLSVLLDPHVCWLKPSWSTDRLLDASSFGAINPYLSWVFMMSKSPNVVNPIINLPILGIVYY